MTAATRDKIRCALLSAKEDEGKGEGCSGDGELEK